MHNGYIKLFRKMTEWEWYQDNNTKSLFLHCLIKANFTRKKWLGMWIERGTFVTSIKQLSNELKLSESKIRLSIKKLNQNEISLKTTNKNTIITIRYYDTYQPIENENNKQTTIKTQTNNKQTTTTKNNKNLKNEKNKELYTSILSNWNSHNITIHKKITSKTKTSINNLLKDFDISDILKAIENYSIIYHSKKTFFSYKWTLEEFLKREKGMRVFLYKTENDYLIKDNNKKSIVQFESLTREDTGEITF